MCCPNCCPAQIFISVLWKTQYIRLSYGLCSWLSFSLGPKHSCFKVFINFPLGPKHSCFKVRTQTFLLQGQDPNIPASRSLSIFLQDPNIPASRSLSIFLLDPNIPASRSLSICFKVNSKCKRLATVDQTNSKKLHLYPFKFISQPLIFSTEVSIFFD